MYMYERLCRIHFVLQSYSGQECIANLFIVCDLNPEPIEYECWCDDRCDDVITNENNTAEADVGRETKEENSRQCLVAYGTQIQCGGDYYVLTSSVGVFLMARP